MQYCGGNWCQWEARKLPTGSRRVEASRNENRIAIEAEQAPDRALDEAEQEHRGQSGHDQEVEDVQALDEVDHDHSTVLALRRRGARLAAAYPRFNHPDHPATAAPASRAVRPASAPDPAADLGRPGRSRSGSALASISASVRVRSSAWKASRQARLCSASPGAPRGRCRTGARERSNGPPADRIVRSTSPAVRSRPTTTARSRSTAGKRGIGRDPDLGRRGRRPGRAGRSRRSRCARRAGRARPASRRVELADPASQVGPAGAIGLIPTRCGRGGRPARR